MIVFHRLERNDLVKIVDLEVAKVVERVRAKDIKVHLDATAVEFLIDKGYDPTYGARPMRRAVEKYLEDPLAEEFLRGNIKQGDTLEAHAAGEQLTFKVAQPEQSEPVNGSPLRSRGDAEERRADGFSVSPAHSHFSELGALVDSRNATASSRVLKLPSE